MKLRSLIIAALLCVGLAHAQQVPVYLDESRPVDERIEDVLRQLTLDEKIALIHAQSKFSSPGVARLGIPDFWTDDGPHGVRPDVLWDEWEQAGQTNDSCVAFPALTCLAASWNPEMSRLYGESLGEEARYRNKSMILGPGINILRTPLGGRNFEYFGEDPWLTSRMVIPYIQGLQSKGVSACVKHFTLNNDENYRHQVNVIVSDRALHEIYLPGFKAAVTEAGTWGLMGAYNLYQNVHVGHHEYLFKKILRGDWNYDGVIVSDWGGTHDTEQSIKSGLDMEFGTWTDGLSWGASNAYDNYYMAQPYKRLIQQGKYGTTELDEKVRHILRLFFRTTMRTDRPRGFLCSKAHYDAALRIAQEGIVLLKNKGNLLPIDPARAPRILVVGENAIKMMTVGGGSSSLKVQREILPLDGIKARYGSANVDYARGYVGDTIQSYNGVTVGRSLYETRSEQTLIDEAVDKARKADYVIMFGGLNKSDHQDAEGFDRNDYGLPYAQNRLIEALVKANPNFVYVNISGNPVELPFIDKLPALVQGWFLGSESGEALASVIAGDVNPSGKLPYSWYRTLNDCAAHALDAFPGIWRPDHQIIDEEYKEGIYVGYRWLDKQNLKPTFAFGYGMSYTTFTIGDVKASQKELGQGGTISFTTTVTNTGKRAGAETVQLYVHDSKSTIDRPYKELKAFKKVYLEPGQSQQVTLTIGTDALSYYDEASSSWKAEPGEFIALVGNASDNLKHSCKFTLK